MLGLAPLIQTIFVLAAQAVGAPVWAGDEIMHPGYLSDVADERYQITREVIIVPPVDPEQTRLIDRIFTEKLTKEFSKEFRDRFGHTEFEQLQFTSNRFVELPDSGRAVSVDEYIDKQEAFGQYMGKELLEYHVDRYLKGNRNTRNVYKVKEKLSNVQVTTKAGYKFKFRYKLASNKMTFQLERPKERFHQQVDVADGDATLRLGYDVNRTVALGTDYAFADEIFSIRGSKKLTPALSTSITGQSFQKDTPDNPKQERLLLGLSWND